MILEIEINGAASEVVVGSLSKEELNRIHKVMKENDLVDDDDYDYTSFYYDSSLVSEAEVAEWYDTDNFLHQHGSYTHGTIVVRNHETEEELYSGELNELFKNDEYTILEVPQCPPISKILSFGLIYCLSIFNVLISQ